MSFPSYISPTPSFTVGVKTPSVYPKPPSSIPTPITYPINPPPPTESKNTSLPVFYYIALVIEIISIIVLFFFLYNYTYFFNRADIRLTLILIFSVWKVLFLMCTVFFGFFIFDSSMRNMSLKNKNLCIVLLAFMVPTTLIIFYLDGRLVYGPKPPAGYGDLRPRQLQITRRRQQGNGQT